MPIAYISRETEFDDINPPLAVKGNARPVGFLMRGG